MKKMFIFAMTAMIILSGSKVIYGTEIMNKSFCNYGSQQYGKETLNFVQANGSVILEGTKVLGLVQVNGSLKADESAMERLQVNGQADLHNCVISDFTIINGSLNADNTKFQKNISIASQKVVLGMCSVDSLTIREVNGSKETQIVDLRSGTTVTGPIVVESGNGEIWITSNSEISENQVTGAKVFRK